jgi:hypothetical protein
MANTPKMTPTAIPALAPEDKPPGDDPLFVGTVSVAWFVIDDVDDVIEDAIVGAVLKVKLVVWELLALAPWAVDEDTFAAVIEKSVE